MFRERFEREADLAAALFHQHIVGVHDRGEHNGQLWITMDFVDGADAGHILKNTPPNCMPLRDVADIITAVASGLDYAHRQGLLHRDVKPANIILTPVDGDGHRRIMLADFGIARPTNDISGLTVTNMAVGTVAYSAPEQLMGQPIDGRADQYALAATAYHLLTGSAVFPHTNPVAVISHHLSAEPPAVSAADPTLAALDPVLATALHKRPDHRFPRCIDFANALTDAIERRTGTTQTARTRPPSAPDSTATHHIAKVPALSAVDHTAPTQSAAVPPSWLPTAPKRRARGLNGSAIAPSDLGETHAWLRRRRIIALGGLIALLIGGVTVFAGYRDIGDDRSVATSSATTMRPTAPPSRTSSALPESVDPAPPEQWDEAAQNIVDLFPGLLPATPSNSGYNDARSCTYLEGSASFGERKAVVCTGLSVNCLVSGAPFPDEFGEPARTIEDIHVETWSRASGTGRVQWDTSIPAGTSSKGRVRILFDDAPRSACQVEVVGLTTGQDLYDSWFPNAPF